MAQLSLFIIVLAELGKRLQIKCHLPSARDRDPRFPQLSLLIGIVGQQLDRRYFKICQHFCRFRVIPRIGFEAQLAVCCFLANRLLGRHSCGEH